MKNMFIRTSIVLLVCAFANFAVAQNGLPVVTAINMSQDLTRIVTIKYKVDELPAVVTLDVKTNATVGASSGSAGWVSIGGEHIWNAEGAVWRKVTSADVDASGWCKITWRPDQSWKIDGEPNGFRIDAARIDVRAWPMDNTPDYMVVDIIDSAQPNTQRYYPAVDFLPGSEFGQLGAITNNPVYKESKLVMRKIMAAGVEWTKGSVREEGRIAEREQAYRVTLTNNYYIGVFEVTQEQWWYVKNAWVGHFTSNRNHRPVESVSYAMVRLSEGNTDNSSCYWPHDPHDLSFLGILRKRSGLDFDLPSEAEWEFACRAGNGEDRWNDGSMMSGTDTDANLGKLGRYKENGSETAIVGSYRPSDWGLYDMHGNVCEFCLDWMEPDWGSVAAYCGRVNIDPANPSKTLSGKDFGGNCIMKSGSYLWNAKLNRSAQRSWCQGLTTCNDDYGNLGFRVICRAGLK